MGLLAGADPNKKAEIEDLWIKELVIRKREEIERVEELKEGSQNNIIDLNGPGYID